MLYMLPFFSWVHASCIYIHHITNYSTRNKNDLKLIFLGSFHSGCAHFQLSNLQTDFVGVDDAAVCWEVNFWLVRAAFTLSIWIWNTHVWSYEKKRLLFERRKTNSKNVENWDLLFILWFVHVQTSWSYDNCLLLPLRIHFGYNLSYRYNYVHPERPQHDDCTKHRWWTRNCLKCMCDIVQNVKILTWHMKIWDTDHIHVDEYGKWLSLFCSGTLPSWHWSLAFTIWQTSDKRKKKHIWEVMQTLVANSFIFIKTNYRNVMLTNNRKPLFKHCT